MGTETYEAAGNKHVDVNRARPYPYHIKIGELVRKHTSGPDATVFDIGCGIGHLERQLEQHKWQGKVYIADAYDICLETCAKFRNVVGQFKLDEDRFDVVDKVGDQRFDCIVMSHVLEHIHNPSDALNNVMSLLNPGGVAIIAVPNPVRPATLVGNMFKRHYANKGHVQSWDPSHWRVFLEDAMKLDVIEYTADFVDLPKCRSIPALMKVSEALAKPFPWWSFSNIATIRAPRTN